MQTTNEKKENRILYYSLVLSWECWDPFIYLDIKQMMEKELSKQVIHKPSCSVVMSFEEKNLKKRKRH